MTDARTELQDLVVRAKLSPAQRAEERGARLWMLRESKERGVRVEGERPEREGSRLPPYDWGAFVLSGDRRIGFEIMRTTSPRRTRSMHAARESLGLDHLYVVHAGDRSFPMREDTAALAFGQLFEDLEPL